MMSACGIWLVGLGCYFAFFRPSFLPEDLRFVGHTSEQIRLAVPGLAKWLQLVFVVMGGFMAAAGVLTVFVAQVAMSRRLRGTSWVLGITGVAAVAVMSAINFYLYSDYRWVLLVPALIWLAGVVLYVAKR